jgi:uncharacterized protein
MLPVMTMKLSRLFVYPLKSAAGIELQDAVVDEFGIQHDRRWLIVDHDGVAVTQREHPELARLKPTIESEGLRLDAPGRTAMRVSRGNSHRREVQVWNDRALAADVGQAAADWISDYLGQQLRIVYMPDQTFRRVDPAYSPAERRVSFADAFPFLILSQESMDGLNRRLEQPLLIERFRPNIVVTGAREPHAEDGWQHIRVGDLEFDLVKPCARCAVPTVDPKTGERGKEPTRTLSTYRKREGKVYFGQNAIHSRSGQLNVGDLVEVLR